MVELVRTIRLFLLTLTNTEFAFICDDEIYLLTYLLRTTKWIPGWLDLLSFQGRWNALRKLCPYLESFWSLFSHIWTECVERYGVSPRIHSECRKMRTRISPGTDTFYAVMSPRKFWKLSVIRLNVLRKGLIFFS